MGKKSEAPKRPRTKVPPEIAAMRACIQAMPALGPQELRYLADRFITESRTQELSELDKDPALVHSVAADGLDGSGPDPDGK